MYAVKSKRSYAAGKEKHMSFTKSSNEWRQSSMLVKKSRCIKYWKLLTTICREQYGLHQNNTIKRFLCNFFFSAGEKASSGVKPHLLTILWLESILIQTASVATILHTLWLHEKSARPQQVVHALSVRHVFEKTDSNQPFSMSCVRVCLEIKQRRHEMVHSHFTMWVLSSVTYVCVYTRMMHVTAYVFLWLFFPPCLSLCYEV